MSILESAKRRYATKHFSTQRKISENDILTLQEILRLTPTSVNIQPWHFLITDNENGKIKITESTQGNFIFNQQKILDSSHVVVFCLKTDLNEQHLNELIEKELADGRYTSEDNMLRVKNVRESFFNNYFQNPNAMREWASRQLYIALGTLLLAAADMGIDSLPIEGFDAEILSKNLNLTDRNLEPLVMVALGYSTDDDFNKHLPKSRFTLEKIFTKF